ncbi:HAD hydrolase-like protein [Rhodobacterales bacterium LSUCC0031]|nr:HAD hydrolase-like protein [Rhodobacterales bacterium LSUCC0031]
MTLEAVIFSGIGTLAEVAELDRAAWNAAFRAHGVDWHWSWDVYAELMRQGGDRQLAARYAAYLGHVVDANALDRTHQRQFATMLAGGVPLRPGVARVMNWAARGGVKLALVSRAEIEPVRALLKATARERGGVAFDVAILRDDASHMAPHPAGMVAAITKLGIGQGRAVAVVDTALTREAAQAAGLPFVGFSGRLAQSEAEVFEAADHTHALSPEALTSAWRGITNQAAE